jgi:hypothetical protein
VEGAIPLWIPREIPKLPQQGRGPQQLGRWMADEFRKLFIVLCLDVFLARPRDRPLYLVALVATEKNNFGLHGVG